MQLSFRTRPFGQARPLAVLAIGLPASAAVGAAAGWLCQGATHVLALLALPGCIFLAAGAGIAVAAVGRRLRCRSAALMLALGAVAGLSAELASWAAALRHARNHGLTWVESGVDEIRRGLDESRQRTEALRRLMEGGQTPEEMQESLDAIESGAGPFDTEPRTETVRARTLAEYVDFRWRRGWAERGHEVPGVIVAIGWTAELASFVCFAALFALRLGRMRGVVCATDRRPLAVAVAAVPDIDAGALSAAAAAEDLSAILAVPRWPASGREGRYEVRRCPDCGLAVVSVEVRWRGLASPRARVIVEDALLDADRLRALEGRLGAEGFPLAAAPADAPA
jgi:hypothetical protein